MTTTLAAVEISNGEAVLFWILGPIALAGAFGTVLARNAIHAALFLVMTMGSLGVFYFIQEAPFLGVVQIIVYTGAIMMLFLFVLMLVGVDSSDAVKETIGGQRLAAAIIGLLFGFTVVLAVGQTVSGVVVGLKAANGDGNPYGLSELLFGKYVLAFEFTSALLITAALGAMNRVTGGISVFEYACCRSRASRSRVASSASGRSSARPGPVATGGWS